MREVDRAVAVAELAEEVACRGASLQNAASEISALTGLSPSTGKIYIGIYLRLLAGRNFNRRIPEPTLRRMLLQIRDRHGAEIFNRALGVVKQHVEMTEARDFTTLVATRNLLEELGEQHEEPIRVRARRELPPSPLLDRLERIERLLLESRVSAPARLCPLASEAAPDVIQYLGGRPSRDIEIDREHLRSQLLRSTRKLVLVDPYFFAHTRLFSTKQVQIAFLASLLPQSLEEVEVFHLPNKIDRELVADFGRVIRERGIVGKRWGTDEFHDRVVLHDAPPAIYLGTSFNGFGGKLSFVMELPQDDRAELLIELDRIRASAQAVPLG